MVIDLVPPLLLTITGLMFVFFNWKPRFRQDESETFCSENFVFDWALCCLLCEVYHFQNLVGLELPIKYTLNHDWINYTVSLMITDYVSRILCNDLIAL